MRPVASSVSVAGSGSSRRSPGNHQRQIIGVRGIVRSVETFAELQRHQVNSNELRSCGDRAAVGAKQQSCSTSAIRQAYGPDPHLAKNLPGPNKYRVGGHLIVLSAEAAKKPAQRTG